nr:MAG TPA: hypothetical protein [Bacteriophage sp.]
MPLAEFYISLMNCRLKNYPVSIRATQRIVLHD